MARCNKEIKDMYHNLGLAKKLAVQDQENYIVYQTCWGAYAIVKESLFDKTKKREYHVVHY